MLPANRRVVIDGQVNCSNHTELARTDSIMPEVEEDHPSPFQPLEAELDRMRRSTLTAAIDDVDGIIELLELARQQISEGIACLPDVPADPDQVYSS